MRVKRFSCIVLKLVIRYFNIIVNRRFVCVCEWNSDMLSETYGVGSGVFLQI